MQVADYLKQQRVGFDVIPHRDTYDAQRMAATIHVSGREVAKTVLLRAGSEHTYVVAVLPANRAIDLELTAKMLGAENVEIATEQEISEHCPDCEIGVLPPFGTLYGMKTIVDESLVQEPEIVFESNSHHEAIRMTSADFRRVEKPLVGTFTWES